MAGGFRPLHAASHKCQASMVRLLLDRGADPNARTDDGLSPADVAGDDQVRAVFDSL
jgi:ankyrin repeat protein